ncbi:MAG TPA: glycosyl transferase [Methylophilaceae bacterium]|nr:glycosyl transferase [Methylophilaceae bacterium]
MRFNLDHDWQGNMSIPRAKVGERAKIRLLIVLCAIWLCLGLTGHSPWKPYESQSISIIKSVMEGGSWLTPLAASQTALQNPPLFYIIAAIFATLLSPILPIHDAARLSSGMWMLVTLLMIGMTGREIWGRGIGRQTTLIFIGCLGLVLSAHTLMPAVASLTGIAIAFYALALSKRRPYRASVLLGLGLGVSFLSTGLLPALMIISCSLTLPLLFAAWRSRSFASVLGLALLFASPLLLIWPILSFLHSHTLFIQWWESSLKGFDYLHHLYFLKTLLWFAWPALPLALWGVWRFKNQLLTNPHFQLIVVFFTVSFIYIGLGCDDKEIFTLPLLIPLTALAGGSIETLKRGAASALSWFGLTVLGLISLLIWLGWIAMLTGNPAKIKERLVFLSGLKQVHFNLFIVAIAVVITLSWLFAIFRSQHSNRASATNWAIGMTCVWTLLMTLWLPMLESARSYSTVFTSLKKSLPKHYACVNSNHVGDAQRDLLHYYAHIKTYPLETVQQLNCDLYLIQDDRGRKKIEPGHDWKLIWKGKRISERKEGFRLFQTSSAKTYVPSKTR